MVRLRLRLLVAGMLAVLAVVLLAWLTSPAPVGEPVSRISRAPGPRAKRVVPSPTPRPQRLAPTPAPPPDPEVRGEGVPDEVPPPTTVTMDNSVIHDAIRATSTDWAVCYAEAEKSVPGLVVDIRATWVIEDGMVTTAEVTEGETEAELVDCLLGAVEEMAFPPGTEGEVTWPFRFGR